MNNVLFSVEDLKTPEALERVLRQLQAAMSATAPASPPPSFPSISTLVGQLAPLLRDQLQATGGSPLNLQSLLPTQGQSVLLEDTHANRIALYPASNYAVGTVFYETDRTVAYTVVSASGAPVWQYISGVDAETFANRPIDLSTHDRGYLLWITVQNHICWWSGSAWTIVDGGGGYFVDSAFALTALGWQLCDGTATDYLVISGADLALTSFTTPNEVTIPGVYHKSIAVYTGAFNAAAPGTITGSTASTTATNNVNTTGVTVAPHTIEEIVNVLGLNDWAFPTQADANHAVTDPGHNHTQNAHNHGVGTLAVDATGEPRNLGVLRYFRR